MKRLRWLGCRQRLAKIELLVMDVDGVLTDGGLWFDGVGQLVKRFDVRDGLGIQLLMQSGVKLAFLSGGQGGATEVLGATETIRILEIDAEDVYRGVD